MILSGKGEGTILLMNRMKDVGTNRILDIIARLEAIYGAAIQPPPRFEPLDELIACILSQHTSDINSSRAFKQLKSRFPTWELVELAPVDLVADSIRSGGLGDCKAVRIQTVLKAIREKRGELSLNFLQELSDEEGRDWLISLPGVGPKTAAIVLCFSLMRPALPVDTHVFRVSWRLGLIDKRIGEAKAHEALKVQVPCGMVYRFHVALIQHGRQVCKAPVPRCGSCPLASICLWRKTQIQAGI